MAESESRKSRLAGRESSQAGFDADEDPLVELARIVSEDGGFYSNKAERPKPVLQEVRREAVVRDAVSADLEAELLQELESSFATRKPAAAAPQAVPPIPPPSAEADELLKSIEEQLGAFERQSRAGRPAARAAPAAEEAAGDELEQAPPPVAVERPAMRKETPRVPPPALAAEADDRPAPPPSRSEARSEPEAPPVPAEGRQAPAAERPAAQRPAPQRMQFSSVRRRDEPAQEPARRVAAFDPSRARPAAPSEAPPIRREPANDPGRPDAVGKTPADAAGSESGVLDGATAASLEAEFSRALEPTYSDPTFGGHWQEAGMSSAPAAEQERPPVATVVPAPARPAQALPPPSRRSRGGLRAAAAILVLVLIGGGLAAYLRMGNETVEGPPPVIAAPEGEVKVAAPEAPAPAEGETVGEAVYQRVAGAPASEDEELVDSAEEPREVARIVLPPPQADSDAALVRPVGADAGAQSGESIAMSPPAGAAAEEAMGGPRQVRTFTIRPDGTVVESESAPAASEAPAAAAESAGSEAAADADPIASIEVPTVALNEAGQPDGGSAPAAETPEAVPAEPAIVEVPASEPPAAAGIPAADEPAAEPPAAETAVAAVEPAEPAPAEPAAAEAPAAEAPAAASSAPVDLLTANRTEATAETPPVASSGYVVQLSAQRSEEQAQATFNALKRQYPSVLGQYDANIQRADLGEKGIYYRVRVGPWEARAEAIEVCEAFQAAGGSCFVTR